jgi:Signal transduction histidine kinase
MLIRFAFAGAFQLAGNGIKFTAEGGVAIELQMTDEAEGAVGVSFLVRDTGIGIAEADQQRVFGEFEQADPRSRPGARRHRPGTRHRSGTDAADGWRHPSGVGARRGSQLQFRAALSFGR